MPRAFVDQVVFITGASSGIGAALAREFSQQGARVVLAARRKERIEVLATELGTLQKRAVALQCDVARDADVEQAVAAAVAEFGRLDVVVANAGISVTGNFDALSTDEYRRVLETNLFGVLRTVRVCLPELKKTQGRIGIVGSISGLIGAPGTSAYCISKFAVRGLAQSLAAELAGSGVSVTHIAPGFVDSEIRLKDNQGQLRPDARDPVPGWLMLSSDKAARAIVRALYRRKREAIITFHGKLLVFLQRWFPWLVAWLASKARPKTEV